MKKRFYISGINFFILVVHSQCTCIYIPLDIIVVYVLMYSEGFDIVLLSLSLPISIKSNFC